MFLPPPVDCSAYCCVLCRVATSCKRTLFGLSSCFVLEPDSPAVASMQSLRSVREVGASLALIFMPWKSHQIINILNGMLPQGNPDDIRAETQKHDKTRKTWLHKNA